MSQETAETLRKARGLIELGWCQHAAARSLDGVPVGPAESQAVQWCAEGAIRAVTPTCNASLAAVEAVRRVAGGHSIAFWNDTPGRTARQVLYAFDRAIAAEEQNA